MMKRKKPIVTLMSVILVFFLFTPVLIRSLNATIETDFKDFSINASSGSASKLDTQLPFEEREKEEEAASHTSASLPLIAVLSEPLFCEQYAELKFHSHQVSLQLERQPRYLIIRSLLI